VKTLKDDEYAIEVLRFDAYAIVLHEIVQPPSLLLRIDAHDKRLRTPELQRVPTRFWNSCIIAERSQGSTGSATAARSLRPIRQSPC
jgi:hypothetical protein